MTINVHKIFSKNKLFSLSFKIFLLSTLLNYLYSKGVCNVSLKNYSVNININYQHKNKFNIFLHRNEKKLKFSFFVLATKK